MATVGIDDFNSEVEFLRKQHPQVKDRHEAFCFWFLLAQIVDNETQALEALTGEPGDKTLDAIVIDDNARSIYFIQTKLHDTLGKKIESRDLLVSFATLADLPGRSAAARATFMKKLAPRAKELLEAAIPKVNRYGYSLHLYYATTGRCSDTSRDDATSTAYTANADATFEIIDAHLLSPLLQDYIAGMAPPPGLIKLELSKGTAGEHALKRVETGRRVMSWILTAPTNKISELYQMHRYRLFARNIRGYLGPSKVNSEIIDTLKDQPTNFWYFNNGITIICDRAEMKDSMQGKLLEIFRPQIINGLQTTRTIAESPPSDSEVIVKVIAVSRTSDAGVDYEDLLSKIVRATNWQNAIKQSDLISNDQTQIRLEREFRKRGYQYVRKTQTKKEARKLKSALMKQTVTKFELAMSLAACLEDPAVPLQGKEGLFGDKYYDKLFPKKDPKTSKAINYGDQVVLNELLAKYWIAKVTLSACRGDAELAYAKWFVAHDVWHWVGSRLNNSRTARLVELYGSRQNVEALEQAIRASYRAAMGFYSRNKREDGVVVDRQSFFKRLGRYRGLESERRNRNGGFDFRKAHEKVALAIDSSG